jgi:hypothetical protein
MDAANRCPGYRRAFFKRYIQVECAIQSVKLDIRLICAEMSDEPDFSCASDRHGSFGVWLEQNEFAERVAVERMTHPGCATSAGDNSDRNN